MTSPGDASSIDFSDIDAFIRIPRLTTVATGPHDRVVAVIQQADEPGSRMVSAIWELDAAGQAPARRLTYSDKGDTGPVFAPDGSLLFTSARPGPGDGSGEDTTAVWRLPVHGEPRPVATAPGGLKIIAVAGTGHILAATSVLPGGSLSDDAQRRAARKDAKRSTIWHTGLPVRYWDRDLNGDSARLVLIDEAGTTTDLTPDADTVALHRATADLSADGRTAASTWTRRTEGGDTLDDLVLIDTATGQRTVFLTATHTHEYASPKFARDGSRMAVTRITTSTPTDPGYPFLEIHRLDTDADPLIVDVGDMTVVEYVWTERNTLLVAGDLHSSGAVLAVDGHTGRVRTVADDAVYSSLAPGEDGTITAMRSDNSTPPRPVRITSDGAVSELSAPGAIHSLPGRLERVVTDVDGVAVTSWLCIPHSATEEDPAPVMLWVHGGPHGSFNAWKWRWCPWPAVARGYAVLMPDPAMSTGYGHAGLRRGWPRRPDVVFTECETALEEVLQRPELDRTRTAMLGGSFGGFMANWIAGHTDRFDAIVTHASLWALDQQHRTTDMSTGKMRVHGHEDDHPDWYRAYSPHHSAAKVATPMLITHGDRDFRVPISEALRQWWDLVSGWEGPPESMPHRFLQLTGENHWVLTPSNSRTWYETVLAFCDQHVRGGDPIPDTLPW